jgi:hydroxymethylpyrimidine pyrophosphatase-like HAD family hydrolase
VQSLKPNFYPDQGFLSFRSSSNKGQYFYFGVIMYSFYHEFKSDDLNHIELLVFMHICCNSDYSSKSSITLAKEVKLSRRSVFTAIKSLEKKGKILIKMIGKRKWMIYPLSPKVSATSALYGKDYSAPNAKYSASHDTNIVHDVQHKYKGNIKEIREDFSLNDEDLETAMSYANVFKLGADVIKMIPK